MACGKRSYQTEEIALEALIGAHTHFDFNTGAGPITFYKCDDCGNYHLTSTGTMNEKLAQHLKEGKIDQQKEADHWERKWRR
jgi:hypothetical protein